MCWIRVCICVTGYLKLVQRPPRAVVSLVLLFAFVGLAVFQIAPSIWLGVVLRVVHSHLRFGRRKQFGEAASRHRFSVRRSSSDWHHHADFDPDHNSLPAELRHAAGHIEEVELGIASSGYQRCRLAPILCRSRACDQPFYVDVVIDN